VFFCLFFTDYFRLHSYHRRLDVEFVEFKYILCQSQRSSAYDHRTAEQSAVDIHRLHMSPGRYTYQHWMSNKAYDAEVIFQFVHGYVAYRSCKINFFFEYEMEYSSK
jgi:hypothetical protein